ncbi:fibronectin-binding protein A N-terminus-domain-containing protein [Diaporthe sp. PMI_573]|nr:fibronectin-binding protein A N-terminus-domain-containing protein [Diaporthaceae sp. PMI_573]
MKQRFSSLDVKAITNELSQSLVGLRLANIYDISSKKFLLKFAISGKKEQLIVDSGFRLHTTEFTRPTAAAPSAFTSRLRKYLKTRRCTSLSQIGTDRIIELQFSDGGYRLFLEFFASGNVILTDADLKILAILRTVHEGEGQEPQGVGLTYSLENRQNYGGVPPLTKERVREALQRSVARVEAAGAPKKKPKRKAGDELRRGLATTIEELPPIVVDHAFEATGFEPTTKPADVLESEALFDALFKSLEAARRIVDGITGSTNCKGYIIAKRREAKAADSAQQQGEKQAGLLYEDFQPFVPQKFEKDDAYAILTFDNYNKTVDEFFSSIEGQKLESRLNDKEAAAKRKLEAVREIQEQKVESLKQVQILNMRKAGALEANVDRVQEAMDAVNGLIAQGMDWVTVDKLIEREQKRRNPVAQIVKLPLNLEQNSMTLLLAEEDEAEEVDEDSDRTSEDESDDDGDRRKKVDTKLSIEINLGLSPYANAREYYDQKKTAAEKEQKTVGHSVMALKSAEKKIAEDLKKGLKQEKPILYHLRRQSWFEKFIWFISSDGYLVLGGRDAMQNEMLYKKYLRKGDVYVHADFHGAASIIVKNSPKTPDAPIPPSTLSQAGSLSVCSSNAWDSKAGMGAWWVNAEQVSKSAPTGEYLPSGSFMVRGTKNYLPPQPLILGFGFVFKISEESKGNHIKHRLVDSETLPAEKTQEVRNHEAELAEELADLEREVARHEQDDKNYSDGDVDDDEGSQRENPLQVDGDNASDSGDDVDGRADDGDHVDPEIDHVTDNVNELNLEEPAELMMSGALAADGGEHENPSANDANGAKDTEAEAGLEAEDTESETATKALTEASRASMATTSQQTKDLKQNNAPAKRGKKNKQKKIAAKYKDQDEEDRAMHEELIGATKGREKAEAEARAKAERLAEEEARRERRKIAQQKQQKKVAEHEEIRKLMLEEGIEVLDDDEEQASTPLDSLVGTALPGDEIVEVLPICAPWAAMARCKYKVKIQPGATKKGKALKDILERWKLEAGKRGNVDEHSRDSERMWPREVELIKTVKPEDVNNVVPVGKLTVMMSGGGAGGKAGGGGGKGSKGGGNQSKGGKGGKGGKKKK